MSSLNGQELEIFKAVDHGHAKKRVFTPAELRQISELYATEGHEAPIVIGHPDLNAPAFGWIKSVRTDGSTLYATPHQVVPEFDGAVQAGHYKKRSAAFDKLPGGKWRLRHVGYLGGTPPVVKGLADATFASEQYEQGEEFSTEGDAGMAETQQVDKKTITETIREVFADMFGGKEKTTQTVDVDALEKRLEAKFAAAADDKVKTLQTEFADYKAKHEKSTQQTSAKDAIAKLKADKCWLPAFDRMGVPELFAAVAEGSTEEFEFADSKDTKKKQDPLTALTTIMAGFGKIVPKDTVFSDEVAAAAAESKPVEVKGNANVDPGSLQFDREVRALMDKDKITYAVATSRLVAQGKSSASYAVASSGAV